MTKIPNAWASDGRTLGSELRARRLGFGWLDEAKRYVRITARGRLWIVDAAVPDMLPSRLPPADLRDHPAWWEHPECFEQLAAVVIPQCEGSHIFKQFIMDDNGTVVE